MDPAATDDLAFTAGQSVLRFRGSTGTDKQSLGPDLLAIEKRVVADLGEPQAEAIRFQRNKHPSPGGTADQPTEEACRGRVLFIGWEAVLPTPGRGQQDLEPDLAEITTETEGDRIADFLNYLLGNTLRGSDAEGTIEIHRLPGKEFH